MNYSNISANSPLEAQMKKISCFCKAAAWGFFGGGVCGGQYFVCFIYLQANKTSAPVSVERNQDHSCWCSAIQFKRSAARALCIPHSRSFRRKPASSEGNKHVHLPTSYLCLRQSLQQKTRHSLWPPCHVQQLLGAIGDNIVSPCGTWLVAELSAGGLPHWQIRVPNISLSSTTAQNYSLILPSNVLKKLC